MTTRRTRPFFSAIPIQSKCYRGQLAHGLSVTLYYPIQRVGLGRECFFTVVTLVPLRMVMLLRDLHYDHLDIVEGHRQRGCSDMVAGNTGQILTEAGPSVHGVLLVAQLFCSSKVNCHLDLGATPSVQATVHQMGTFLIHFSILPYYTRVTTATAARRPSMVPYWGASGLAIWVYSITWPPSCPGALPTRCTIESAPC